MTTRNVPRNRIHGADGKTRAIFLATEPQADEEEDHDGDGSGSSDDCSHDGRRTAAAAEVAARRSEHDGGHPGGEEPDETAGIGKTGPCW